MSNFIYLLNAMEAAAQASNPALEEYGIKRRKVLEYVADLEARVHPEGACIPQEAKLRRLMDEVRANGHMMSNPEILHLCREWLWVPPSTRYSPPPQPHEETK